MWSWPRVAKLDEVDAPSLFDDNLTPTPRATAIRSNSLISISSLDSDGHSTGADSDGIIHQLQNATQHLLVGSAFDTVLNLSSSSSSDIATDGLFFFFEEAVRMMMRVLPIIDPADRAKMLESLKVLIKFLAMHRPSAADGDDADIGLFVQICRTWKAAFETSVAGEIIPRIIKEYEESLANDSIKTAREYYVCLDKCGQQHGNLDELAVVMRRNFPPRMRAEALKIMGDVGNHPRMLLAALNDIVWVGVEGRDEIEILERKSYQCIDAVTLLSDMGQASTRGRVAQYWRCVKSLKAAIIEVNTYIDPERDRWATRQDIVRKLELHRSILSFDGSKFVGVLPLIAAERQRKSHSHLEDAAELRIAEAAQENEDELVEACLSFLQRFCYHNKANQMAMATAGMFFFSHFFTKVGVTKFLYILLHENREVVVNFEKDQVEQICSTIRWSGSAADRERTRIHLMLLQSLVISESRPVVAMQHAVFQAIVESDALDSIFWKARTKNDTDTVEYIFIQEDEMGPGRVEDPTSRLNYHVGIIHLLALCATENEDLVLQLRHFCPLHMFILRLNESIDGCRNRVGVLRRTDVPPQLFSAYLHLFQAVFVESVGVSGHQAVMNTFVEPHVDASVTTQCPYDALVDAFEHFLQLFIVSKPADVYPSGGRTRGGLISLLAAIFANKIVETADGLVYDHAPGEVNRGAESHRSQRYTDGNRKLASLVKQYESGVATKLHDLVVCASTQLQRKQLSLFVAALNLSAVFDSNRSILCDEPKTDLKAMVDKMRAEMAGGGFSAQVKIDSSEKLLRVARMAWSDAASGHTVASPAYPEDFDADVPESSYWWSEERATVADRFQMARWVASAIKESSNSGESDTESDGTTHSEAGTGFAAIDKTATGPQMAQANGDTMHIIIETVLKFSESIDVEAIIMGLNGALLADAWTYLDKDQRRNPTEDNFIATRKFKEAVVPDFNRMFKAVNGYSVLASYLRKRYPDAIISRVARFGLLLLQGDEDDKFSSKTVQYRCLAMERKRVEAHEHSIKGNLMELLDRCVHDVEGDLSLRYRSGTRIRECSIAITSILFVHSHYLFIYSVANKISKNVLWRSQFAFCTCSAKIGAVNGRPSLAPKILLSHPTWTWSAT